MIDVHLQDVVMVYDLEHLAAIVNNLPGGVYVSSITKGERLDDPYRVVFSDLQSTYDLIYTDYLSGLYNRRYLIEYIENRIPALEREPRPFGIVMLDIDDFASINNTYGHNVGDRAIQHIATALTKTFKRKTDIVSRYGGDEFVVLLSDIGNETNSNEICKATCTRLMNELSKPIHVDDKEVYVTVSIGVSFAHKWDRRDDLSELFNAQLSQADTAMYYAKKRGKNQYVIYNNSKENQSG